MSKKLSGTLLGILTGLAGIALYVVLYAFVGLIPGIAMILVAFGFYGVYMKLNPTDNSWYPVIIASILTIVGAVSGMFLGLVIIAAQYDVILGEVLHVPEVQSALTSDLIFTLVFAFVAVGLVILTKVKASKTAQGSATFQQGAAQPEIAQPEVAKTETRSQPEEGEAYSASAEAAKEKPTNQD
ncbi:MAG: hypothetical protein LBN07_01490 [Christensenellaceae bacterium]|jgi:hypothetical protein|nr:hypothetical protein [Christensenellaceae bacterium]